MRNPELILHPLKVHSASHTLEMLKYFTFCDTARQELTGYLRMQTMSVWCPSLIFSYIQYAYLVIFRYIYLYLYVICTVGHQTDMEFWQNHSFYQMLIVETTMIISSSDFVTVMRIRDRKIQLYTKAPTLSPHSPHETKSVKLKV